MTPIPTSYLKAGAAALALALSFAAGWTVESWRMSGQIEGLKLVHQKDQTALAEKARAAEADARSVEQQLQQKLQEATNAARKREITLRRDADGARVAAVGLRDQLAAIRRGLPDASSQARADTAAALAVVLERCSVEYRDLAETADRHASDVQSLIQAWPAQ